MTIGNPDFTVDNNPFDPTSKENTEEGIYDSIIDLAKESIHHNNIDSELLLSLRARYSQELEGGDIYTQEKIVRSKLRRKRPNQRGAVYPAQKRMILDFKHALNTPLYINVDKDGNYNVMEGQQHGCSDAALGDPEDLVNCIVFRNMPEWFEEWFFLEFNCESRTAIQDYDRIRMGILMERKSPTGNDEWENLADKQTLFEKYGFRFLENKPENKDIPCSTTHSGIFSSNYKTLNAMFKYIGNDEELRKDSMIQITWGFWDLAARCGWHHDPEVADAWRDLVLDMTGQENVKSELTAMFNETARGWSADRGARMIMGLLKKRGCKSIDMKEVCDKVSHLDEINNCIDYSPLACRYVKIAEDRNNV